MPNLTDESIDLNAVVPSASVRLGVISDTHNRINRFVINALSGCNVIVHAGDIGEAGVLHHLEKICPYVFSVRGNNDNENKWPRGDLAVLATIPHALQLHFHNQTIAIIHGHQYEPARKRHDKLRQHFPQADMIIYGHSHRYACDQQHRPWVINPGAGGYTRTFGGASCIVATFREDNWAIEPYRQGPSASS